jgi:diaminopimelate epimerase
VATPNVTIVDVTQVHAADRNTLSHTFVRGRVIMESVVPKSTALCKGLAFVKIEGTANDFVVLDERSNTSGTPALDVEVRSALCDRHTGVGADGILTILPSRIPGALARMHITNADGSVPEMCGNGLRCVGRFLVDVGALQKDTAVVIDTDAGPRTLTVHDDDVTIDMGPADLFARHQFVPLRREPLAVDNESFLATTVSMGNPHVVLEGPPDAALAAILGPKLEHDARYPERINVELARLAPDGAIDVVVWERGVGLTMACGTGACAVAAAFVDAGLVPAGVVTVRLPGGPLLITVPAGLNGPVLLRGPVRRVFGGVVG